jgi:hypothetical protein
MNTNTSHLEHAQQVINTLKEQANKLAKENALPGFEVYYKEGYMHGLLGDLARDVPGVVEYIVSVIKINNVS